MARKFSDQIRDAIRSCELSCYRIAVESGVAESSLSRFLAGQHGLTTESLDRIAEVLRIDITCRGPRKSLLARYGTGKDER